MKIKPSQAVRLIMLAKKLIRERSAPAKPPAHPGSVNRETRVSTSGPGPTFENVGSGRSE